MASRLGSVYCFIIVVALVEAATATDYELPWVVPSSTDYYTNWTSTKTFEVGDAVIFNWTGTHNVADVSKSEYDNCTKTSSILHGINAIKVNLSSSGNRYFICTVDEHCQRGQKVAIAVQGTTVNDTGSASFMSVGFGALYAVISISVTYFLSYN